MKTNKGCSVNWSVLKCCIIILCSGCVYFLLLQKISHSSESTNFSPCCHVLCSQPSIRNAPNSKETSHFFEWLLTVDWIACRQASSYYAYVPWKSAVYGFCTQHTVDSTFIRDWLSLRISRTCRKYLRTVKPRRSTRFTADLVSLPKNLQDALCFWMPRMYTRCVEV